MRHINRHGAQIAARARTPLRHMATPPTAPTTSAPASDALPGQRDFAGNRATARVLLILSQFTDGSASHGVTELSRELGMTKNMIHRALKTLTRYGYLVRDASGARYQLGPGVLQLGRNGLEPLNLPMLATPYLQRLQELSEETTSLAVRVGRTAVTIAGVRGRGHIARRVPFGRSVPLHASPASRAILAFLPDDEIAAHLAGGPLESFTPATITTDEGIWTEVAAVREAGYAMSFGDHVGRGATGISFPVLAGDGTPHGSVTIAGPSDRFTEERRAELIPAFRELMAELNRRSQLYPPEQPALPPRSQ
jgi:DNA-binding IclR family transcriptional regulator